MAKEETTREKVGEIDGVPVFTTKAEALTAARALGCSATHEKLTDTGEIIYMPCADGEDKKSDFRSAEGTVQKRTLSKEIELRQEEEGNTITGYAAVFNTITDLGTFREQIAPEAFNNVLENSPNTVALINHDQNLILGRTTSNTLKLSVDDIGLKYELKLGNQSYAKDLAESMRRNDLNRSSFAFTIESETWQENVRTVNEVRGLYDISIVTSPAYKEATASIRAAAEVPAAKCGCTKKKETKKRAAASSAKLAKLPQTNNNKYLTMKNSDQLKSLRSNKLTELNALVEVVVAENRDYTEAEIQRQEQLNKDVAELDNSIQRAETTEANVKRFANVEATAPKGETVEKEKMQSGYNLQRAISDAAQGRLSGVEAEMHQEALREASAAGIQLRGNLCVPSSFINQRNVYGNDATLGGVNDGVSTTSTSASPLFEALRPTPIIESLGATQLTGFVGDIKLPSMPTDAASQPAEGAAATSITGSMEGKTLSPQRFASQIILTKEALNQANGNMSDVIARDFGNAIGNAIDSWAFARIAAGTAGFTASKLTPTDGDLADAAGTLVKATETATNDLAGTSVTDVINLWQTISSNYDVKDGKFVMSPLVAGKLMRLSQVTNGQPIMTGNICMGYDAIFTGNMPQLNLTNVHADAILDGGASDVDMGNVDAEILMFGDFSHLFYATWGGLSLTVDPFSGATEGNVKIVADQYADANLRTARAIGFMAAANATIAGADS